MFIVKIMKYPIYMSLSYNSPDFQYKAAFEYTCPRASCEQRACAWMLLVSVLVSEVELKLSNNGPRTDPWGTPQLHEDVTSLHSTYCCLFEK
jgi:hypothetical protein